MSLKRNVIMAAVAASLALTGTAFAGGVKYKNADGDYVKLGGRIQLQYHSVDPKGGTNSDSMFFRRFRPYIEGSTHAGWKGKFQFDLGKAGDSNEVAVKDAYMQYKGFDNMKVTIGNAKSTFSREALTSSKKQQLVERTFVGDHNYGSLDRTTGVHVAGHNGDKNIEWSAQLAQAAIDPDAKKLDFDSLANRNGDFNEGFVYGARVDFHPFGKLKKSQGDFKGEQKATVGLGAFSWSNDDDNNTHTDAAGAATSTSKADVDSVTGMEVSAGYRNAGFSIDAQYNTFEADTVDTTFTGGIYKNGSTTLENYAIEAGYMAIPNTLEVVAGYESQDADGYADSWNRTSVGANYFVAKHDIKFQLTYRMGENLKGVIGNDENETFLQAQFVF
ncbi:MAG: porin [Leptospirillia bacterium]